MTTVASLSHFIPEIVLLVGAVGVLFSDLVFRDKRLIGYCALGVIVVSLVLIKAPTEPLSLFGDFFLLDKLTQLFRVAALAIVGIVILLSLVYSPLSKLYMGEYYALLLFSAFGLILMSAATNLLMIFLAIEFVSLISYVLVGFLKADKFSKEASLKYLLFGSVCSAFMLYGMSLLYGLTGTLRVTEMSTALASASQPTLVLSALVMIFAGLGFKISMAPFHLWAPDVYEGAPTPVTAFLTVGPKALGFVVLIRVLSGAFDFEPISKDWTHLILVLSIVTMTVGNIVALSQTNIKRLIAYSSIAQAGYILMGIATFSDLGIEAVIVYAVAYAFTNLGLFVVVVATSEKVGSDEIQDYAGLAQRSPLLAGSMLVFFLSLAGIPPMAGFIGKYLVFAAVIQEGYYVLAVAAALNSIVAAAYYFKVVKTVYLQPASDEDALACPWPLRVALGVTLTGTILLGVMPSYLIEFVQSILPLS